MNNLRVLRVHETLTNGICVIRVANVMEYANE